MSDNPTLLIFPKRIVSGNKTWRQVFELTWPDMTKVDLWWEYPNSVQQPDTSDCDAALIATVLPAMAQGLNIRVHGCVSPSLLANLEEYQMAWAKWRPESYHVVRMETDRSSKLKDVSEGAVVAFSGGLDAHFSVLSHVRGHVGARTQNVKAAVMIHGLDIPLQDKEAYSIASGIAEKTLLDLGVTLINAKTNIREVFPINWEHHCGCGVASGLVGLKSHADCGLIASGEPYDALVTPWGSNPITDPLLSSDNFTIRHDGTGFNRTEKAGFLAEWQYAVKNLRVCWQDGAQGRNCGCCEKCVRTRLNFLISGTPNPACFEGDLTRDDFKAIVLISEAARKEWQMIAVDIAKSGNGLEFLPDVKRVLRRSPVRLGWILPLGTKRRTIAKRLLKKLSR